VDAAGQAGIDYSARGGDGLCAVGQLAKADHRFFHNRQITDDLERRRNASGPAWFSTISTPF
jgi:hypothetical protein